MFHGSNRGTELSVRNLIGALLAAVASPACGDGNSPISAKRGEASYYWLSQKTANGEAFNPEAMTCAHKTLGFDLNVRVTNLRNGRSVICRINDRGPFKKGRIIDLSRAGARAIGMVESGVAPVEVEIFQ